MIAFTSWKDQGGAWGRNKILVVGEDVSKYVFETQIRECISGQTLIDSFFSLQSENDSTQRGLALIQFLN